MIIRLNYTTGGEDLQGILVVFFFSFGLDPKSLPHKGLARSRRRAGAKSLPRKDLRFEEILYFYLKMGEV